MTTFTDQAADARQALRDRVEEHRRELAAIMAEGAIDVVERPTEPIDMDEQLEADVAGKELATIEPYDPDNDWINRSWNAELVARRERPLFRALGSGDEVKVLKALTALERKYAAMRKEYGKTRAFAIDYEAADAS